MNKRSLIKCSNQILLALLLVTNFPGLVMAEDVLVVVSPQSTISTLSRSEIINIYMGRQKRLPTGEKVTPLDLVGSPPLKEAFYEGLLGKQVAEVNSYWARLIFSGRDLPPRQMKSYTEMIEAIKVNSSAIGYVSQANFNDDLLVVFRIRH